MLRLIFARTHTKPQVDRTLAAIEHRSPGGAVGGSRGEERSLKGARDRIYKRLMWSYDEGQVYRA